jgi:hypothetical protein
MGLWWLLLALAPPLTERYLTAQLDFFNPNAGELALQKLLPIVLLFAVSVAINMNFLIATAALTGSPSILRVAWRFRFLIDVTVTLAFHQLHFKTITLNAWSSGAQ